MDNILSEKIKLNNVLHSFTLFTLSFCNCQELEITFGVFRRVINTDRQELKVNEKKISESKLIRCCREYK